MLIYIRKYTQRNLEKETHQKGEYMWYTWRKPLNIRKQNFWKAYKCEKYAET